MALRLTEDRVNLEFERTIPLLGREFRTKASRAGKPPYYELVQTIDGYSIQELTGGDVTVCGLLVGPMTLRDMHFLLEGIALADRLIGTDRDEENL